MGFLDNATDASVATLPRWAKILEVGPKVGPLVTLRLEVHQGHEPIQEVETTSWVPRSITPRVGQMVAYRVTLGDARTHYQVVWDKPPQYGKTPPAALH